MQCAWAALSRILYKWQCLIHGKVAISDTYLSCGCARVKMSDPRRLGYRYMQAQGV